MTTRRDSPPHLKLRAVRIWLRHGQATERSLREILPNLKEIFWVNMYMTREIAPRLSDLVCCPYMHSTTKTADVKEEALFL